MLMLYFSGTGNSQYIAQNFAAQMGAVCHSIEEDVDFSALIAAADTVAFCYPIYGSSVPRLMRDFVNAQEAALQTKKLIVFCTQMMFSGDGARAFTDLLPGSAARVIYAEHFNMPNNISNLWFFPIRERERRRKQAKADRKLARVCLEVQQGIVRRRGWGRFSHWLGLSQSSGWPKVEEKKRSSFLADQDCTRCGLCVRRCPMQNLRLDDTGISQQDRCMLCYRCVNLCPQKAATVLLHTKPKTQYKGIVTQEGSTACINK